MGLDQYAYVAVKSGQQRELQEPEPREIAYWRKHPNLQGWMRELWESKGNTGEFNGDEVELTWEDIDALEDAVRHKQLPGTSGFFFGNDSDDYYFDHDMEFIKKARTELFMGLRVFYNSSW